MWGNRFGSADPTKMLGTGDFDGDGRQDLLMATCAAWYYRPAGTLEWRFLNDSTLTLDQITLQDVDGDGRTDAYIRSATRPSRRGVHARRGK